MAVRLSTLCAGSSVLPRNIFSASGTRIRRKIKWLMNRIRRVNTEERGKERVKLPHDVNIFIKRKTHNN
jgi:hypothetical protein